MFERTPRAEALIEKMTGFLEDNVYPAESVFEEQAAEVEDGARRPQPP